MIMSIMIELFFLLMVLALIDTKIGLITLELVNILKHPHIIKTKNYRYNIKILENLIIYILENLIIYILDCGEDTSGDFNWF